MGNIKRYIIPVISIILLLIVWNAATYLKQSSFILQNVMSASLPFKVNPFLKGGTIASEFDIQIDDNAKYTLPQNQIFENAKDSVDIITYKVYNPVNISSENSWAIDIEFKNSKINDRNPNGFDLVKGSIYIDIDDGINDGSNISFYSGEKINFTKDFMWDYYISFDPLHKDGTMFSYKTQKSYPVKILFFSSISTIQLRIPFVEKIKSKMDNKYMGGHIAAIGFYSSLENGSLIPVKETSDNTNSGGGKNYLNFTPYYDFVADNIDISAEGLVTISPVKINKPKTIDFKKEIIDITKILKENYPEDDFKVNYKINDYSTLEKWIVFYDKRNYLEAEIEFLKFKDISSGANSYLGVIEASKSNLKNASVSKKVEYVNNAFNYFTSAEKLIKSDGDKYLLFVNRYNISINVPDEIFGKMQQAINDLKNLLKLDISNEEKAKYYQELLNIYEKKGNIREEKILLNDINNFLKQD